MCFAWSDWAKGGQLDALEHLVRGFGPILAPWSQGALGPNMPGSSPYAGLLSALAKLNVGSVAQGAKGWSGQEER